MTSEPAFQRARTQEQREARRQAILNAAAGLLAELPLSDISLRELARRVGLSKTNVVRYFETREAVFFALLNQTAEAWVATLPTELPPHHPSTTLSAPSTPTTLSAPSTPTHHPAATGTPATVADALARSLAAHPLLCELWSALGTELERNISTEAVINFKLANGTVQARLATLVAERVPDLSVTAAREFVSYVVLLVAGLWPFANPAPAVREAVQDPRLTTSQVNFATRLSRALQVALTGLLTLEAHAPEKGSAD